MSTRWLRRICLLVVLPLIVATALFMFLRSDYFIKWRYDRPLHVALTLGDYAGVQYCVSQGADVNMSALKNGNGAFTTPILMAIHQRDVPTAREFIRKGANLGFPRQALNVNGQLVFVSQIEDNYPLWVAVKNGDEPMISLLLKSGAKTNEEIESHGFTVWILANYECDMKPTPKCRRIVTLLKRYWKPQFAYEVRPK